MDLIEKYDELQNFKEELESLYTPLGYKQAVKDIILDVDYDIDVIEDDVKAIQQRDMDYMNYEYWRDR